jgi:hypothetical protein
MKQTIAGARRKLSPSGSLLIISLTLFVALHPATPCWAWVASVTGSSADSPNST